LKTIRIFEELKGIGLDIGYDGSYILKDDSIIKVNMEKLPGVQIVCNAEKLPFKNNSFDKIMLRCILEHVIDPMIILKETKRVLKPEGKCVIEVPFINPIHAAPDDYRRYTPDGLIQSLEKIGLIHKEKIYIEDLNWSIRWLLWQRLKMSNTKLSFIYLVKMILLKYIINPLLLKEKKADELNYSSFCIIAENEYAEFDSASQQNMRID